LVEIVQRVSMRSSGRVSHAESFLVLQPRKRRSRWSVQNVDADLVKLILQKAPSLGPAGVVVALWGLKAIYNSFKEKESNRDAALVALNTTLHENTLAIVRLTTQMEYLNQSVREIPELRKDIDGLGDKVRKMQKEIPNGK